MTDGAHSPGHATRADFIDQDSSAHIQLVGIGITVCAISISLIQHTVCGLLCATVEVAARLA